MAYVDKITRMRRMALITPGGHIAWEGVNIEGSCLLKEVNWLVQMGVATISEENLDAFCEQGVLRCVYQDPVQDESWEPREEADV